MARHPDWFERLDSVEQSLRDSPTPSLGRSEIEALFTVSEREAIRLLHRFGAVVQADALSVERSSLLHQLDAVRRGTAYGAFRRQREGIARQLAQARSETTARKFRVRPAVAKTEQQVSFSELPDTIAWRRTDPARQGRFEIRYDNGEDLMWQLAEFLRVAGQNRADFFRATEPAP